MLQVLKSTAQTEGRGN